jgi:hypothetical protein
VLYSYTTSNLTLESRVDVASVLGRAIATAFLSWLEPQIRDNRGLLFHVSPATANKAFAIAFVFANKHPRTELRFSRHERTLDGLSPNRQATALSGTSNNG